jgi:predicted ATP-dependent endonuclease of OLD family
MLTGVSMKIARVEVRNFRLLKNFSADLQDNLSLVIGKNNAGKTSFLDILEKFLSNSKHEFFFDDFNIDIQKKLNEIVESDCSPENFEEVSISLKLYISYDENDNLGNIGDLILDLDMLNTNIVIFFEYVLEYEKYKKLRKDFQQYDEKIKRGFIYYISQKINTYFRIRIKALEYNNDVNSKIISDDTVKAVISLQTIGAKRDVDNEQGNRHTLSSLAYKYYMTHDMSDINFPELQQQLFVTEGNLTDQYHEIFKPIVDEIKSMSYNPQEAEISIISSLSEKKIFQENTTVKYKHNETLLPEGYNGLGYLNLFAIIFNIRIKLNDLSKKNNQTEKPTPINLLFIEEPEAHTHPQMQYVFIMNIKLLLEKYCKEVGNTFQLQTIISTHSSHIISQCDFDDIKYFFRESNISIKSYSLKDLYSRIGVAKNESASLEEKRRRFGFLKQYVTLNRSELFFADKAILIEGDTERLLLSAMMKKFDNTHAREQAYQPLLSQNISVIEVGAYAQVFAEFLGFLNIKTLVITDLDCAKKNQNGRWEKCKFDDGEISTNKSIKFFLNCDDLGTITSFTADQKTLKFDGEKWVVNSKENLRIIFQCEENNYQARSFEDSFICKNLNFIIENKNSFSGLKNTDKIVDGADFYEIAENCIESKTKFALDILYYGGDENEIWQTPKYIEEGLEWLQRQ